MPPGSTDISTKMSPFQQSWKDAVQQCALCLKTPRSAPEMSEFDKIPYERVLSADFFLAPGPSSP
jgi:hypothetical protein